MIEMKNLRLKKKIINPKIYKQKNKKKINTLMIIKEINKMTNLINIKKLKTSF